MNTLYIKLFAGLGNQIFQYVYGKKMELDGKKVVYLISRPKREADKYIDFPGVFHLSNEAGKQIFMADDFFSRCLLILKKVFAKYFCHAYEIGFYQKIDIVDEVADKMDMQLLFKFDRSELYSSSVLYKDIIGRQNSVSIHIRGGDYLGVGSPFSDICTADYYRKAIEYLQSKVENAYFYIFTNDREFSDSLLCKMNLNKDCFTYVQDPADFNNDPGYDMFLMSNCNHNIIANSTYSWWGAFLNQNKDKIVVLPVAWTKDNSQTTEDIKPSSWIAL